MNKYMQYLYINKNEQLYKRLVLNKSTLWFFKLFNILKVKFFVKRLFFVDIIKLKYRYFTEFG